MRIAESEDSIQKKQKQKNEIILRFQIFVSRLKSLVLVLIESSYSGIHTIMQNVVSFSRMNPKRKQTI